MGGAPPGMDEPLSAMCPHGLTDHGGMARQACTTGFPDISPAGAWLLCRSAAKGVIRGVRTMAGPSVEA
jgi:hypothetical protein